MDGEELLSKQGRLNLDTWADRFLTSRHVVLLMADYKGIAPSFLVSGTVTADRVRKDASAGARHRIVALGCVLCAPCGQGCVKKIDASRLSMRLGATCDLLLRIIWDEWEKTSMQSKLDSS